MKTSVCVVVVFNHRYEQNIAKIKKIYEGRFSKILFLSPFYEGDDPDVIPVYESSRQFQGYFIQAYEKLMKTSCQYFLIVADDMIINPTYNEANILTYLGMENKKVGIDCAVPLNKTDGFAWHHARYSSHPFLSKGTEWKTSLPAYEKALNLFEDFWGEKYLEKYGCDFYAPKAGESKDVFLKEKEAFLIRNGGEDIPYPMAHGYSDILCIRRNTVHALFHRMGIFSAMNLWVEIAIPTSIVLTVPRNEVTFFSELPNRFRKVMWDEEEISEFAAACESNYKKLAEIWERPCMYVHPVKLSRWEV